MNIKSTSELQKQQSIQLESPFLNNDSNRRLNQLDRVATRFMARYGLRLLSLSMGVVILWFGAAPIFTFATPHPPSSDRTRR